MKKLKIVLLLNLLFLSSYSQTNEKIVFYFKNKKIIDPIQFLFTPNELIELCKDSIGKATFIKSIKWVNNYIKSTNIDEAKEKKTLMVLIKNKISSLKLDDDKSIASKLFIAKMLNSFSVNFQIDENYLYNRFNTKDEQSFCNTCISMYIFFVYDPDLYVKIRSKEKNFISSQVHFPLAYILQDCNIPIEIISKMQNGLLEKIKNNNEPIFKKISSEIKECDITNRCD